MMRQQQSQDSQQKEPALSCRHTNLLRFPNSRLALHAPQSWNVASQEGAEPLKVVCQVAVVVAKSKGAQQMTVSQRFAKIRHPPIFCATHAALISGGKPATKRVCKCNIGVTTCASVRTFDGPLPVHHSPSLEEGQEDRHIPYLVVQVGAKELDHREEEEVRSRVEGQMVDLLEVDHSRYIGLGAGRSRLEDRSPEVVDRSLTL